MTLYLISPAELGHSAKASVWIHFSADRIFQQVPFAGSVSDDFCLGALSIRSIRPGLGHNRECAIFAGSRNIGSGKPADTRRSDCGFAIIGPGRLSHIGRRCKCTLAARSFAYRSGRPMPWSRKSSRSAQPIRTARRSRAKFFSQEILLCSLVSAVVMILMIILFSRCWFRGWRRFA